MTTELRDRLAALIGWQRNEHGEWWHESHPSTFDHPINGTLDQLAALWREHLPAWKWVRAYGLWQASRSHVPEVTVPDTGNEHEYADRLALTVAVMKKEKANGQA